jgi:hypothetical protein
VAVYTLGVWTVKAGREQDFIDSWPTMAAASATDFPGSWFVSGRSTWALLAASATTPVLADFASLSFARRAARTPSGRARVARLLCLRHRSSLAATAWAVNIACTARTTPRWSRLEPGASPDRACKASRVEHVASVRSPVSSASCGDDYVGRTASSS